MDDFYPHIDVQQYGNVQDSSTTHYLVDVVDTVLKGIDEAGHYATLCAVDFTKAFDSINHNIAVQKLIDIGIRPSIIPVIGSFLCNRTQTVRINGKSSTFQSISGGVPQVFSVLFSDAASKAPLKWKYVDNFKTFREIISTEALNCPS